MNRCVYTRRVLLGICGVFCLTVVGISNSWTDVQKTYGQLNTEELRREEVLSIFYIEDNTLHIPDRIQVDNDGVIEVVQGKERETFEPIKTIEIQFPDGDILKAKQSAYNMALTLATREYQRAENDKPRRAEGFYIDFSKLERRPTAIVTLCDYDESYRDKLLASILNLTKKISDTCGRELQLLEKIKEGLDEYKGSIGKLKSIEGKLGEIEKDLAGVPKDMSKDMDSLERKILRELSQLRNELRKTKQ